MLHEEHAPDVEVIEDESDPGSTDSTSTRHQHIRHEHSISPPPPTSLSPFHDRGASYSSNLATITPSRHMSEEFSFPPYQSPLGPPTKRARPVSVGSSLSFRESSSHVRDDSSALPPSPPASRSVSVDTSFDGMSIDRAPDRPSEFGSGRSVTFTTPTPISNTSTHQVNSLNNPLAPMDIRATIAQMRADGRLRPPPSILDDLSGQSYAASSRSAATDMTPSDYLDMPGVKVERNDSDEDLLSRGRTLNKGKQTLRLPLHTTPLFLRSGSRKPSEQSNGSTREDQSDKVTKHVTPKSRVQTTQREALLPRKPPPGKIKRLGPRARAKKNRDTLQWVMSVVPTVYSRDPAGESLSKRKIPDWML